MDIDIDIDLSDLGRIKDPNIRFVANQLWSSGIAITSDDAVSRRISRRFPEYRPSHKKNSLMNSKPPILVMGPDRRANVNIISINPALPNRDVELGKFLKKLINGF